MIHSAALGAFLFDTVASPNPWFKWLLPTLVQTIVSLLSIGAGVAIAVWSFRKNHQSEHEQWVRDQKRTEWREILKVTSNMETAIPAVSRLQDRYNLVSQCLPKMIPQLLGIRGNCIFIADVLDRQEVIEAFDNFIMAAANAAEFLQGFDAQIETDPNVRESCRRKYAEIRSAYLKFSVWLKSEARKNLGVVMPAS